VGHIFVDTVFLYFEVSPMKRITAQIASSLAAAALAVIIASCATDNPASPDDSANPATAAIAAMEQNVQNQINQHRASIGLGALTLDATISAKARQHSKNMADGTLPLGHDGFDARVAAIQQTIPLTGAGENVAFNFNSPSPVDTAVIGWLHSPPHKANIEGNFDMTGIGIVQNSKGEYYFTQIFIKRQ
jgi:uncharacterized protein YkwD